MFFLRPDICSEMFQKNGGVRVGWRGDEQDRFHPLRVLIPSTVKGIMFCGLQWRGLRCLESHFLRAWLEYQIISRPRLQCFSAEAAVCQNARLISGRPSARHASLVTVFWLRSGRLSKWSCDLWNIESQWQAQGAK